MWVCEIGVRRFSKRTMNRVLSAQGHLVFINLLVLRQDYEYSCREPPLSVNHCFQNSRVSKSLV